MLRTSQDMLISALWILKNIDKRLLFQLWQNWSYNKLNKILILIDLCVSHFEYRSTVWSSTMAANTSEPETIYSDATKSGKSGKKQSAGVELATSSSNSKLKNKIEDLIIGSTQNGKNEIQRRNKYFSYTSLNPSTGDNDDSGKNDVSMADVAKQAMFKWRRDLNNRHVDVSDGNSLDSMKLILEGTKKKPISDPLSSNKPPPP